MQVSTRYLVPGEPPRERMLLDIHHGSQDKHEVLFILVNAGNHGLQRTEVQPYTCDCGCDLTPERLDEGDRQKSSWPSCKSWRDGGNKRCPDCNSQFAMPPHEQMGRTLGYEVRPEGDYSDSKTDARKRRAQEQYGSSCFLCDSEELHYTKAVPHKFYGIADPPNLIPFCPEHQPGHHTFLDVQNPGKWRRFDQISWRDYLQNYRSNTESTKLREMITSLLDDGQSPPKDPYWRARNLE